MPKREGFLYDSLVDKAFLKKCVKQSLSKKKKKRRDVKIVANDIEGTVDMLYNTFKNYDYTPTPPKVKPIIDRCSGKERILYIQPYNYDGIINFCITEAMKPLIMRGMHHWSCSSVKGRGGQRMLDYNTRVAHKKAKNSKYIAEMDVKKYYPSVPLKSVIQAFERKCKDRLFLLIVAVSIACFEKGFRYAVEHNMSPYDVVGDKVGLMVGVITSQWLGNFYFESCDRCILSLDGVWYESRNMDNIIIAGRNKRKLHRAVEAIQPFLHDELGLELKDDWQVFKLYRDKKYTDKTGTVKTKRSRKISTVGYLIGRDRVMMRQKNFLRMVRQCNRAKKKIRQGKTIPVKMAQGIISRMGFLKHCTDSFHAREKYIYPLGVSKLKKIIRTDAKRRNAMLKGVAA